MKESDNSKHLVGTIERLKDLPDDGYDGRTLFNNSIDHFIGDNGKVSIDLLIPEVKKYLHPIKIDGVLHMYDRSRGIYVCRNLGGLISRDLTGEGNVRTAITKEIIDTYARDIMYDTPVSREYVAFRNGLLNTDTGALEPRRYQQGRVIKVYYDFDFRDDLRYAELHSLKEIADHDTEILESMLSLIGAVLFGRNLDQRAYILLGSGSNGKSTFLNMLRKILGDENYSSVPLDEIGDRFRTAELYGRRANLSGDLESTTIKHTSYFKCITGQDTVIAERKYLDPFSFIYDGIPVFAMNDYPYFEETGTQIARRIAVIPFLHRFESREDNREVFSRQDIEVIIINSYRAFVKHRGHVYIPEKVNDLTSEYREAIDPIGAYVFWKGGADALEDLSISDLFGEFVEFLYMMDYDEKYVRMFSKRKFSDQIRKETGFLVKPRRAGQEVYKVFCRGD